MNADDQEPSTSACSTADLGCAVAACPRPSLGVQLAGRYRLVRELGHGSYGTVYEALDEHRSGLRVALKLLFERDPSALARIRREHYALAETTHPNIVALRGLSSDAHGWFVVTDLVDPGVDFVSYVRSRERGFDESRLRASLVQAVRGLAAIHARGMLHGNLKPQNLLLTGAGLVVITDVGLVAEPVEDDAVAGGAFGTRYAAPEQARGEAIGRKADLYAIGLILFEALTGKLPFEATAPGLARGRKVGEVAPRVETLQTDVPSDLSKLCAELLECDPLLRPDAEQTLRALGDSSPVEPCACPCFVAREEELKQLHDAAQRTRLGGSIVVSLRGERGVGKSALLARFCEQLRAQPDTIVLSGGCRAEELSPFRLFAAPVEALSQYLSELSAFDAASLMPRDAGLLTRMFPALTRVPAFSRARENLASHADEALLRVRAFAAFKQLLARIADRKLLVLCLDDLQWSDDDSAELLRELLAAPGAPACLLIGASATDTTRERALPALLEGWPVRVELTLEPLAHGPTEALARELLSQSCSDVDARDLVGEAQGNPQLLEQLALAARLDGIVHRAGEACAARLAALHADTRELVETVALASAPLSSSAALALVEGYPRSLPRALSASLLRLYEQHGREYLEVPQERLRELVLSGLSSTRKRALHASLAHELACDEQVAPELVAFHFRAAGLPSFATPYTLRAAELASRSFAFAKAIELYREALHEAAPHQRSERELALADAYTSSGRLADAAECYERLIESTTDREERRELSGHAMTLRLTAGQVERGTGLLLALCRDYGVQPPPHSRFGRLVFALTLLRHALRRRFSTLPMPTHSRHDDRSRGQLALCFRAMRSLAPWSFEHGAYFAVRAVLTTRRYRDPRGWPLATSWEIAGHSVARGTATLEEDRAMTRAIKLAEQHGDEEMLALVLATEGGRAFYVSRLDESLRMLDRAEQVLQSRGRSYSVIFNGTRSGRMAVWSVSGELYRSVGQAAQWLNEARALGDQMGVLIMQVMGSLGLLAQDDPRAARESVSMLNSALGQRTLFVADPWWFGEVALYEGDFARARAAYQDSLRTAAFRIARKSSLHRVLCSLYLGRTYLLAAAPGNAHDARPVKQVLRRLQREQTPVGRAAAAQLRGSLAHLAGERERAIIELERAATSYARCGMRLYAAAARQRIGILRGGAEGTQLIAQARSEASALGAQNPARWFRSLMPGFDD